MSCIHTSPLSLPKNLSSMHTDHSLNLSLVVRIALQPQFRPSPQLFQALKLSACSFDIIKFLSRLERHQKMVEFSQRQKQSSQWQSAKTSGQKQSIQRGIPSSFSSILIGSISYSTSTKGWRGWSGEGFDGRGRSAGSDWGVVRCLMIPSMVPYLRIIFWWWLWHWAGERVLILLLMRTLSRICFFSFRERSNSASLQARNFAYSLFSVVFHVYLLYLRLALFLPLFRTRSTRTTSLSIPASTFTYTPFSLSYPSGYTSKKKFILVWIDLQIQLQHAHSSCTQARPSLPILPPPAQLPPKPLLLPRPPSPHPSP